MTVREELAELTGRVEDLAATLDASLDALAQALAHADSLKASHDRLQKALVQHLERHTAAIKQDTKLRRQALTTDEQLNRLYLARLDGIEQALRALIVATGAHN